MDIEDRIETIKGYIDIIKSQCGDMIEIEKLSKEIDNLVNDMQEEIDYLNDRVYGSRL